MYENKEINFGSKKHVKKKQKQKKKNNLLLQ
jgi:hypothetical protein